MIWFLIDLVLVPVFFFGFFVHLALHNWGAAFGSFVGLCFVTWPLPAILAALVLHGGF